MNKLFTLCCALLGMSAMAKAQDSGDKTFSYIFDDATKIDVSTVECLGSHDITYYGENSTLETENTSTTKTVTGLVSQYDKYNDGIAYFTESSVSTSADSGDGILTLYGARGSKDKGPNANTNDAYDPAIPCIGTSGKTQSTSGEWFNYFKVEVPEEYAGAYIGVSSEFASFGSSTRGFAISTTTVSGDDVTVANAANYLGIAFSSDKGDRQIVAYSSTEVCTGGEVFYLICSDNIAVYNVVVTFSSSVVPTPEIPSDAISSLKADGVVEVARYNVLGQKIEGEQKGVNIVKYSDGTTAKVLVK